jgi:hypothetical protein
MSDPIDRNRRALACAALAAPLAWPLLLRAAEQPPLPGDNATAVALAYTEDAANAKHPVFKPGSTCANCQFYTGDAGAARGPCSLFPGFSVSAEGWCSAWATKS